MQETTTQVTTVHGTVKVDLGSATFCICVALWAIFVMLFGIGSDASVMRQVMEANMTVCQCDTVDAVPPPAGSGEHP